MPLLTPPLQRSIVIIGKENTGKSQLIASLTEKSAYSTKFCSLARDLELLRQFVLSHNFLCIFWYMLLQFFGVVALGK